MSAFAGLQGTLSGGFAWVVTAATLKLPGLLFIVAATVQLLGALWIPAIGRWLGAIGIRQRLRRRRTSATS